MTNLIAAAAKPTSSGITNPVLSKYSNNPTTAANGSQLFTIISAVLSFIMLIAVLLVLLNIVEAGINWIASGGDKSKIETARNKITQAVIGIIILSASVAIWKIVKDFLGVSFNFALLFP